MSAADDLKKKREAAAKAAAANPQTSTGTTIPGGAASGSPLGAAPGTAADLLGGVGGLAGTGSPGDKLDYSVRQLVSQLQLSPDAAATQTVNVAGIGKYGPVPLSSTFSILKSLSHEEIVTLQKQLYEAGFYPNDYYRDRGLEIVSGSLTGDIGFADAYRAALVQVKESGSTFQQVIAGHTVAAKPLLAAKALQTSDRVASDVRSTESERRQAKADADRLAKEARDYAASQVVGTQEVSVPALSEIGRTIDTVATNLLGRTASDDEKARIGQIIQDQYRQSGLKSADIGAFNKQLSDPFSTVPGAGAGVVNPQLNAGSAQPSAPMSQYGTADVEAFKAAISGNESGGNYQAKSKSSSAAGKYQYVSGTWKAGFTGGYASADQAPPDVQEKRMSMDVEAHLKKYHGDVRLAALAHFQGGGVADRAAAGDTSVWSKKDANGMTSTAYVNKFMKSYEAHLVGAKSAGAQAASAVLGALPGKAGKAGQKAASTVPSAVVTTPVTASGPGMSSARGVTPYPGAVTTPSGGNAIVTTQVDAQGIAEAQYKANNRPEMFGNALMGVKSVYDELFRSTN